MTSTLAEMTGVVEPIRILLGNTGWASVFDAIEREMISSGVPVAKANQMMATLSDHLSRAHSNAAGLFGALSSAAAAFDSCRNAARKARESTSDSFDL
jgi:hypothetical protein